MYKYRDSCLQNGTDSFIVCNWKLIDLHKTKIARDLITFNVLSLALHLLFTTFIISDSVSF